MPRALIATLIVFWTVATATAQNAPVPAMDAAARMSVPGGFQVTLFAGEPDVVQPIAFTFDDRGRVWVVENHSYPGWHGKPTDRILIFEDVDNDGRFDKKTVFWDQGRNLSGINLGYGGVWLCSVPNLIFVPDADHDDKPDGPPKILLDGWDLNAKHNVFNSLTWGPEGWLYGCNGITSNSKVGKPGTPERDRVPLNCSVWRYHPTRGTFEVVLNGTTNPWGIDFDEYGQIFLTNCVIEHAWHGVPGSNFRRMFGQPFNPNLYELMSSPVDHVHWNTSEAWSDIRSLGVTPTTDRSGGGHAHSGAMIYLGDNWPAEYRNNLLLCNIHGNRLNRDRLERKGSGYVVKHAPDFLKANDPWFRGLAVQYGPDGGVYVADWSDTGECHNYEEVDRSNGRIFKITYGVPKTRPVDLARMSDQQLVGLHRAENQWIVRHARRILAERSSSRRLGIDLDARVELVKAATTAEKVEHRLNAMWTVHACGIDALGTLDKSIGDNSEWIRAWAIRLLVDDQKPPTGTLDTFASLARSDPSPVVRLALASALQRLPVADRWEIAAALAAHSEDSADLNLPLMIWYGVEPMVASDPDRALKLAASTKIPLVRQFIARRYASLAH
jgi:putative membrane-bound dehydrogenase-like protein